MPAFGLHPRGLDNDIRFARIGAPLREKWHLEARFTQQANPLFPITPSINRLC